ncbi:MAG: MFS transporter, partial [Candidatus Nanohaloarchaea archaeon]|nr:MFS transporter [Candidatus Nanohaloarchaea archaeon]
MTDTGKTAFWTIFAVVFLDLLGFGLVIPILPLYAKSYGATPAVVGLLIAIYSAMLVLSSPILGRISDHYGRRPVLLISIGGYAVAWILFGVGGSLLVLFLSRIIAGITGGNIAPAQAYIADITPEEDRADRLGLLGAAFGLGFIFGPGIGGMLSSEAAVTFARHLLPAYIPINKFSLPAFAAAALSLINFGFTLFYLPETHNQATIDKRSQIQQLRDALAEPGLRTLIIAFFIYSLAFSGMQGMFVLFTEAKFGMGTTANGYLLSFMGVIAAVMQGAVVGKLVDRFGEKLLAQAGASLESLALILLPFTPVL